MARTLKEFVGSYKIRHGQGAFGIIEKDYLLCIGTGRYGDPKPDGLRIGISIVDPKSRERVLPKEGHPPTFAYLVDGTLNGTSYWLEGEKLPRLLTYQVALFMVRTKDDGFYRAPSLMITIGDPHNAGVWGADDDSDA